VLAVTNSAASMPERDLDSRGESVDPPGATELASISEGNLVQPHTNGASTHVLCKRCAPRLLPSKKTEA